MAVLYAEIEEMEAAQAVQAAARITRAEDRAREAQASVDEQRESQRETGRKGGKGGSGGQGGSTRPEKRSHLWVDKYRPARFSELILDEFTLAQHTRALEWIKSWSPLVFPAQPQDAPRTGTAASRDAALTKEAYLMGRQRKRRALTGQQNVDPRPDKRLLVLSGAPGMGKTTLAHVLAAHCGYRAVEINASDERAGTALTNLIKDTTENRDVSGDTRPNLLVIDEIDGVWNGGTEATSAIANLVKLSRLPLSAAGSQAQKKQKV